MQSNGNAGSSAAAADDHDRLLSGRLDRRHVRVELGDGLDHLTEFGVATST